jgi:endoglucanase
VKVTIVAAPTPPTPPAPDQPTPPVGDDFVVDNAGAGVQDSVGGRTFTGRWCPALTASKYGSSSLYACGNGIDSYRWTPQIPASGIYDVYVWVTGSFYLSRNVPFVVAHQGGTTSRNIDQRTGSGHWVLHGRYLFNAGTDGYVETRFDQANGFRGTAGADAVRFVRRR